MSSRFDDWESGLMHYGVPGMRKGVRRPKSVLQTIPSNSAVIRKDLGSAAKAAYDQRRSANPIKRDPRTAMNTDPKFVIEQRGSKIMKAKEQGESIQKVPSNAKVVNDHLGSMAKAAYDEKRAANPIKKDPKTAMNTDPQFVINQRRGSLIKKRRSTR